MSRDKMLCGNAPEVLKTLPDACIHMVCTSPPYYGLRSYLPDGHPDKPREIGLEQTPNERASERGKISWVEEKQRLRRNTCDRKRLHLGLCPTRFRGDITDIAGR